MWVIILLEYLVDGIGIFVNVFAALFSRLFLCGRNGLRGSERLGTCLRNGFWGVPKFMNSGLRIVGSVSRCSEMIIKIGYGKWTTPTQATYIRSELYLFNKLGELTGTSPCSLNGCGPAVLFPHGSCVGTCLHSLQDGYRRVSGVYLSHSVRLRLEGNISAAIAAQLCHQHVPETERPDL